MLPINLYLVRHGQSEGNAAKRRAEAGDETVYTQEFRDRHNSSFRLTKRGRQEAIAAGEWLKANAPSFERMITSGFNRAMETAALLDMPDPRWFVDHLLTERDWGDLDNLPESERQERFGEALRRQDADPFYWSPPNGESFMQLALRVDRLLQTLHRECEGKNVLVVCHGEVMRALQVRLERMSQQRFRYLSFSDDPNDRIHNCQIIHYTRRIPDGNWLSRSMDWVRWIRPAEESVPQSGWQAIVRPTYTSDELLEIVHQSERMVES